MLQKRFHFKKWYLGQLSQGSSWAQRILDKKSAAIKYLKGALPIIGSPPVWDTGTVPDSYISGTRPGQGWEFNFSRHQTCQMMRLMLLRYWRAIQNQVNLTAQTVLHLGMPPFQKSAVFLNIVQKAFDPPPFYLNICPILRGVFFKRIFEHWKW